jgi:hypothetical protein
MAFGQTSGPPASHRQVATLLELLQNAGHVDFRDARGPMGFSQRQAAGKFTRDEADTFIEELETAEHEGRTPEPAAPTPKLSGSERLLKSVDSGELAAELQRRGWIVMEPDSS